MASSPSLVMIKRAVELLNSKSANERTQGLKEVCKWSLHVDLEAHLINTDGLLEALSAIGKTRCDTAELKEAALSILCNHEESARRLIDTLEVVDAFVQGATNAGEVNGVQEAALQGLCNLSITVENAIRLFECPRVFDAMLHGQTTGRTVAIRTQGREGVLNLIQPHINKARVLDMPEFVKAMFKGATTEGEPDDVKLNSVMVLASLCASQVLLCRLFETGSIIDVLLNTTTTTQTKRLGLLGLYNLACAEYHIVHLVAETPRVIDVLIEAATNGEPNEVNLGLQGLGKVTRGIDQNRLLEHPGMIEAFLRATVHGGSSVIKASGFEGLRDITTRPQVADHLVENFDLLNVLLSLGPNVQVIRIMLNIAPAPKARHAMVRNEAVMKFLSKVSKSKSEDLLLGANIVLTILTGMSDASTVIKLGKQQLRQMSGKIDACLRAQKVLGRQPCTLNHLLLALRCLTSVHGNRRALGRKWLAQLPMAIDVCLKRGDVPTAESAVDCLLHYAFDDADLRLFQVVIEAADSWAHFLGSSGMDKIRQVFFDVQPFLRVDDSRVNPRIRDELTRIHQGFIVSDEVRNIEEEEE